MNHDDRVDDLLKDLDTALSIEPSPAVTARVRARISAEHAPGWTFWSWRFVAAASAACGVVLVIYMMWPHVSVPTMPAPKSATVLAPAKMPDLPTLVREQPPQPKHAAAVGSV